MIGVRFHFIGLNFSQISLVFPMLGVPDLSAYFPFHLIDLKEYIRFL